MPPPTNVREAVASLVDSTEILDWDPLNRVPVGVIVTYNSGGIVETKPIYADEYYVNGRSPNLIIIDEYADIVVPFMDLPPDKPIKQNGRDASYLKHDRSKNPTRARRY